MPPIRSPPAIPKPIKTERSHEENQERAYIAASRRSDRSLEARIESARRASEIHKRRTGRSLRVTQEDVQNEEMYEEEDDDLPWQFRRLTSHLNPSSSAFSQKLNAHVQYHVAAKTAFGLAMSNQMPQQGMASPNDTLMQNPQQIQHPWMQNLAQMNSGSPTGWQMTSNMMKPQPASAYRFAPYPINTSQGFQTPSRPQSGESPSARMPPHSASLVHSKSKSSENNTQVPHERRTSEPVQPQQQKQESSPNTAQSGTSSQSQRTSSTSQLPLLPEKDDQSTEIKTENDQVKLEDANEDGGGGQSSKHSSTSMYPPMGQNEFPFSTALAPDVQAFLPPAFCMPSLLNGQGYSYNPNNNGKYLTSPTTFEGMNQTLAPSAGFGQVDQSQQSSPPKGEDPYMSGPFDSNFPFPSSFDGGDNTGPLGTPTGNTDVPDGMNNSNLDLSSFINFSGNADTPEVT